GRLHAAGRRRRHGGLRHVLQKTYRCHTLEERYVALCHGTDQGNLRLSRRYDYQSRKTQQMSRHGRLPSDLTNILGKIISDIDAFRTAVMLRQFYEARQKMDTCCGWGPCPHL